MQQELERESEGRLEGLKNRWVAYLRKRAGQGTIPGLTLFLVAVLFARTRVMFGAYPLGIALLCGSRKHTLPVFFGLCVGALTIGVPGFVFGVAYMVALLLRLLISLPLEKESRRGTLDRISLTCRKESLVFIRYNSVFKASGEALSFLVRHRKRDTPTA